MSKPTSEVSLFQCAPEKPVYRHPTIARQSSWQVRVNEMAKDSRGIWIMPLMIDPGKLSVEGWLWRVVAGSSRAHPQARAPAKSTG